MGNKCSCLDTSAGRKAPQRPAHGARFAGRRGNEPRGEDERNTRRPPRAPSSQLHQNSIVPARAFGVGAGTSGQDDPTDGGGQSDMDWRWFACQAERRFDETRRRSIIDDTRLTLISNTGDVSHFSCFLPITILHAVANQRIAQCDGQMGDVVIDSFDAAVVFCDASGFSALTEELEQEPNGAEMLGKALNRFFGPLLRCISEWGGDVLKFSGDALTIVWPVSNHQGASRSLRDATMRAAKCCLDMQHELAKQAEPQGHSGKIGDECNFNDALGDLDAGSNVRFSMHCGLGAGKVTILQVGGKYDRWEYVVAGPPLEQIAYAEPLAQSGETVLSPNAWQLIADCFIEGPPIQSIPHLPQDVSSAMSELSRKRIGPSAPSMGHCDVESSHGLSRRRRNDAGFKRMHGLSSTINKITLTAPTITAESLSLMRRYIPKAVWDRLIAGHEKFIEEMRTASVVFMCVENLDVSTPDGSVKAHMLMTAVQTSVYTQEGSVNKFLVDDKGVLLLVVFGLPPLLHSDDPLRAMLAGQRMVDKLKDLSLTGKVGITTGRVWCGVVGNLWRKEYTVLGDTVNLSARLMGLQMNKDRPVASGDLLCDENTKLHVQKYLEMNALAPTYVKGKCKAIRIYETTGRVVPPSSQTERSPLGAWKEWEEPQKLQRKMDKTRGSMVWKGGVICIRGDSGVGKTEMSEHCAQSARSAGMVMLSGSNQEPSHLTVRYGYLLAWQHVLKTILQYEQHQTQRTPLDILRSLIPTAQHRWIPLLSDVIPGGIRSLPRFSAYGVDKSESRGKMIDLVYEIIKSFVDRRECCLSLHMLVGTSIFADEDEDTWKLALRVAELAMQRKRDPQKRGHAFIFCLLCRKKHTMKTGKREKNYGHKIVELAKECGAMIDMQRFKFNVCSKYLAYLLHTIPDCLPMRVQQYVYDLTGGNPAQILCTVEQLRAENAFSAERTSIGGNPNYTLRVPAEELWNLPIHPGMVGVTMTSIERFRLDEQLLLKVCSVLSHTFTVETAAMAAKMPEEKVLQHFNKLIDVGYLEVADAEPDEIESGSDEMQPGTTEFAQAVREMQEQQRDHDVDSEFASRRASSLNVLPGGNEFSTLSEKLQQDHRNNHFGGLTTEQDETERDEDDSDDDDTEEDEDWESDTHLCRYQFTSALTRMVASRLVLDAQRRGVRVSRLFARSRSRGSSVSSRHRRSRAGSSSDFANVRRRMSMNMGFSSAGASGVDKSLNRNSLNQFGMFNTVGRHDSASSNQSGISTSSFLHAPKKASGISTQSSALSVRSGSETKKELSVTFSDTKNGQSSRRQTNSSTVASRNGSFSGTSPQVQAMTQPRKVSGGKHNIANNIMMMRKDLRLPIESVGRKLRSSDDLRNHCRRLGSSNLQQRRDTHFTNESSGTAKSEVWDSQREIIIEPPRNFAASSSSQLPKDASFGNASAVSSRSDAWPRELLMPPDGGMRKSGSRGRVVSFSDTEPVVNSTSKNSSKNDLVSFAENDTCEKLEPDRL
eukprot:gene434-248_t